MVHHWWIVLRVLRHLLTPLPLGYAGKLPRRSSLFLSAHALAFVLECHLGSTSSRFRVIGLIHIARYLLSLLYPVE